MVSKKKKKKKLYTPANIRMIDNCFIYIPFRSNSISALQQGDTDSVGK